MPAGRIGKRLGLEQEPGACKKADRLPANVWVWREQVAPSAHSSEARF